MGSRLQKYLIRKSGQLVMAMNMYRPSSSQRSGSGSQKSFVSCLEVTPWVAHHSTIFLCQLDLEMGHITYTYTGNVFKPQTREAPLPQPLSNQEEAPKGTFESIHKSLCTFWSFICLVAYTFNKTYTADSPGQVFLTCQVERRTCIPKKHLHGSQLPPQTNLGTCQKFSSAQP